jgi:uncharacterized membrane protein
MLRLREGRPEMIQEVIDAIRVVIERVSTYELVHQANVGAHVIFGSIGLLLGTAQFFTKKGGVVHRTIGRTFLGAFSVVILSATIGSLLFEFRAFLVVITLTAAYGAIAGVRALRIREEGLSAFDVILSLAGLAACAAFVIAIEQSDYPWDKTVIYATLSALALLSAYDLSRVFFPRRFFKTTWIYEHIYKMTGAFSALFSAAFGTIFPEWQPASQLGPIAASSLILVFFLLRARKYLDPR